MQQFSSAELSVTWTQINFGKGLPLLRKHTSQPDKLENGYNDRDHLFRVGSRVEIPEQRHQPLNLHPLVDTAHLFFDFVPKR
jgi:hypothetical protein